jgi:hypothetical protein
VDVILQPLRLHSPDRKRRHLACRRHLGMETVSSG